MARWHSCNILQTAPDANRLWQFDAKSGALSREAGSAPGQPLPASGRKILDVVLAAQAERRLAAAGKCFPARASNCPKAASAKRSRWWNCSWKNCRRFPSRRSSGRCRFCRSRRRRHLQTIIVVIVERNVVEEFLGKLETQGFLADRLEVPMLDQLAATPATEDGAWIYPALLNGQNAALVAWWFGGALRNLSYVVLPADGDRAKSLQEQLAQLAWAGELEGWLTAQPKWHLVADGGLARRMGNFFARRPGRNRAGDSAAGVAGTGGAHGAARDGVGRQQRGADARGIFHPLPRAVF